MYQVSLTTVLVWFYSSATQLEKLESQQHKTERFAHQHSSVVPHVLLSHLCLTREIHRVMDLILIVGFQ